MSKKKEQQALSITKARQALETKREAEASTSVELQVKNMKHAMSEKVLQFCIKELSEGSTWNTLRRKLGLGPSHIDNRWRKIRETLCQGLVPETEEEALKATYSMSQYMVGKLETFLDDLEGRVDSSRGADNEANMLKVQLETIRTLAEKYEMRFEQYINMKKIQKQDQKARGPSVIYNNLYYVPRPGDEKETPITDVKALKDSSDE
jgi:hypothetical protein